MKRIGLGAAVILVLGSMTAGQQPSNAQPSGSLRIEVLEGEDEVNIIQQKTAVRPVVEVRDSNNLPVAGAVVRFTIQGGGGGGSAMFGTQSVATVTTNAAGRAVAPQMQALGTGAIRIEVQATYQSRVATATINQTNYLRAADVPKGRSAGSGSSTSNALSTAGTVAGIGAAAVGGALAIKQGTDANCDASKDEALDDLEAARAVCAPRTPSCDAAAQRAAASLGDWCSCDGRANVDTTVRGAQGVGLAELAAVGVLVSVSLPSSCQ